MEVTDYAIILAVAGIAGIFLASGIKVVRQTHRAAIERFGKYQRLKANGITWIIPFVEKMYQIKITEQITEAQRQEIITKDRLNAQISAQVYFKVKEDEESVKNSIYKVDNYLVQIVALARTTLRNVIGQYDFSEVNNQRDTLNTKIAESIREQTKSWGIDIVRVEIKEIDAPKDVQDSMNAILKAQSTKITNESLAKAAIARAEGEKQSAILSAEGNKQSAILSAEGSKQTAILNSEAQREAQKNKAVGEADAIKLVADANAYKIKVENEATTTYFKDSAITLKKLDVTQASLENNSKLIMTSEGITPTLILNEKDVPTVIPLDKKKE